MGESQQRLEQAVLQALLRAEAAAEGEREGGREGGREGESKAGGGREGDRAARLEAAQASLPARQGEKRDCVAHTPPNLSAEPPHAPHAHIHTQ